jgi:hypothetical protein
LGRISKIWHGEISLPDMFWLYGIGGLIVAAVLFGAVYAGGLALALFFAFQDSSHSDIDGIIMNAWLLLGALLVAFVVLIRVGIWRSAGRFEGNSVWRSLARAGSCVMLLAFGAADFFAFETAHGIHSAPAQAAQIVARSKAHLATLQANGPIEPTVQFPWNGLWKKSCGDSSGYAIEALSQSSARYQLTWCEDRGCTETGDTSLVGDTNYRLVNRDAIDKWDDGSGRWTHLVRCN